MPNGTILNKRTELSEKTGCDLLKTCLNSTYFIHNEKFYQQKQGSPVLPIMTNLYMEHFEKEALDTARNKPALWFRYVDDTMTKLHEYDIDEFSKHLNRFDEHIKFTSESEEDGKIPF